MGERFHLCWGEAAGSQSRGCVYQAGKNLWLLHNLLQEIRLKIFQLEPHSSGDSSKPEVLKVWSPDLQHERHLRTCWKHKLSGPVQFKRTRNTGMVTSNLVLTSPPGGPSAHSSLRIPAEKEQITCPYKPKKLAWRRPKYPSLLHLTAPSSPVIHLNTKLSPSQRNLVEIVLTLLTKSCQPSRGQEREQLVLLDRLCRPGKE